MSNHENWKELAFEMLMENDELRARNKQLVKGAIKADRDNREMQSRIRYYEGKLRESGNSVEPVLDKWDDEGVEECHCEDCGTELPWREWTFCTSCGKWIDWDFAHPQEPDWDALRDAMLDR